jgi:phosphate transporter
VQQLVLGMYPPWSEHYIAYDRLKRLIDRKVFLKKKLEAKKQRLERSKGADSDVEAPAPSLTHTHTHTHTPSASGTGTGTGTGTPTRMSADVHIHVTELTPLTSGDKQESFLSTEEETDSRTFLYEVDRELDKINKFFDSKVVELRVQLDEVVEKWEEQHASHHNTHLLSSHLVEFRHLFMDLSALEGYGPLNRTGFYKIIKKFDKNMNEKNVKAYMLRVDEQNFVASREPQRMIERMAGYVSKSKLVEWKHTSSDERRHSMMLFPSLRPHALAVSLIMFIISFQLPPVAEHNPQANNCMSLLLLVVSLWLSNAMPYFATAMLIPVMIPVLGVMREHIVSSSGEVIGYRDMSAEAASKLILNSFFNHTTVRICSSLFMNCVQCMSMWFSSCHVCFTDIAFWWLYSVLCSVQMPVRAPRCCLVAEKTRPFPFSVPFGNYVFWFVLVNVDQ